MLLLKSAGFPGSTAKNLGEARAEFGGPTAKPRSGEESRGGDLQQNPTPPCPPAACRDRAGTPPRPPAACRAWEGKLSTILSLYRDETLVDLSVGVRDETIVNLEIAFRRAAEGLLCTRFCRRLGGIRFSKNRMA